MVKTADVAIAGGGPAGLATSIALRAHGADVVVIDGAGPEPIDKACGEGLMPDSLAALNKLGVEVPGFPLRGIRFLGSGSEVAADFPDGCGLGVRRTVLHREMTRVARAAGVRFEWDSPVSAVEKSVLRLGSGKRIEARWIVGADGGFSAVRRWCGLHSGMKVKERFGFRKHFSITPWSEHVEVYWGDGCQFYVTPDGPSEVCVAVISRDPRLRVDGALSRFPQLVWRLNGCEALSTERGGVSASRRLRRVTSETVALIGDASGSVDAVTGEGMSLAFHQAPELANAIARGRLDEYENAHARIRRRPALMSDVMLLLDDRRTLRDRVFPAMAARPKLFGGMLASHIGAAHPALIAANLASLGWAMVIG